MVLAEMPSRDKCNTIAREIALQHSDDSQDTIIWFVDTEPPDWAEMWMVDQMMAHRRDNGETTCFMTVVMCTEEEANQICE